MLFYHFHGCFQWKKIEIKLQLLTDIDVILINENKTRGRITMVILINENKTRGRITMTIKRAEANNKYMNNYQPSKSFSFIIHLNFNNQYRHVLTEPIPYKVDLNELKIHMFTENDIKITIKMMKRAIL